MVLGLLGVAGAGVAATPGWARQGEGVGFVARVGADTVAVERVVRTATRLEGEVSGSMIGRMRYDAALTPDAGVERFGMAVYRPGAAEGSEPAQSVEVEFRGDSAIAEVVVGGGAAQTQRLGTREGALPLLPASFGLMEQILLRARALGGDRVEVPLFNLTGGQTLTGVVEWPGADSAVLTVAGTVAHLRVDAAGGIVQGRVPVQDLTIERVPLAELEGVGATGPDYSAPADAPYTAEEVAVAAPAGHVLGGTLTLPKATVAPVPAVVTITGSGGQERDEGVIPGYRPFRQVADALSSRGIAVLRLDDRGVGASTGEFAAATSAAGDSDLRAVALLAAPAWKGRRIIDHQQRYMIERDASIPAEARDSAFRSAQRQLDSVAAGMPWMRAFLAYDPLPAARDVRQPVLILRGEADRQVPAEQAEELAAAIRAGGNSDVTVRVLPATNHLFLPDPDGHPGGYVGLPSRQIPRETLRLLADWLADRLR